MSRPIDDTLTPRNGANFPVVNGPIKHRAYATFGDFPSASTFPAGTHIAAIDEGYLLYSNSNGSWIAQGYGITVPDNYILGSLNGVPTWRPISAVTTTLAFAAGPTLAIGTPYEIGASVAPSFSYTLSRAVASSFRPGFGTTAGRSDIMVNGAAQAQSGTSGLYNANWTSSDVNATRTFLAQVGDGLGPLLAATTSTARRAARVRIGLVANSTTLVPVGGPILSDDFETHTLDAAPSAPWTTTGSTGPGATTIETTLVITSGQGALGTVAPTNGTKMLFMGNLNAGNNVLSPGDGRKYARISVDLSAAIPGNLVYCTFQKRQIGNDTLTWAGFDLDVIHSGGTTQLIHEETSNSAGWVAKSVDLSAYIGQTVELAFSCYDDDFAGDPVACVIDQVVVQEYTLEAPAPPDPSIIDQAWIDANITNTQLVTPVDDGAAANIAAAINEARMLVVYPTVLTLPARLLVEGQTRTHTLHKANVPYTNSFGVTYNVNVYMTEQIGIVGLLYLATTVTP